MLSLRMSSLGTKTSSNFRVPDSCRSMPTDCGGSQCSALNVLANRHNVAIRVVLGAFCTATGRTITPPGYRFDAHDTEPFSFTPPSTRVPSTLIGARPEALVSPPPRSGSADGRIRQAGGSLRPTASKNAMVER